jgi:hypothetical protein
VTNSYLGIITPRGLEMLVVETEHAGLFLSRRAARQPLGEAVVCWAVLDEKTARDVKRQITCRRFQEALRQLDRRAFHLGTVLPSLLEDDLLSTAS